MWYWDGVRWVPYRQPVAGMPLSRPFESARLRATILTICLAANAFGIVLLALFNLLVIAAGGVTNTTNDTQTLLVGLVALLAIVVYFGSFIVTIVFFCMWDHRVVRNMPALGSPDPRWSPAGAVGRCFIPFLNLLHPYWSVLDAWRGADPTLRWSDRPARQRIGAPRLLAGWWACWLIGSWTSNISGRLSNSSDPATVIASSWVAIAADLSLSAPPCWRRGSCAR
jgi:hypothetical protein